MSDVKCHPKTPKSVRSVRCAIKTIKIIDPHLDVLENIVNATKNGALQQTFKCTSSKTFVKWLLTNKRAANKIKS